MKNSHALRVALKPIPSILIKLRPAYLLLVLVLALPIVAHADNVFLTSGGVSVQVPPGQASISISRPGMFSLSYFNSEYFGPLVTSFNFQSITEGYGSVTFQGQTAQFFTGSVSFDSSMLTGQLTAFRTLNDAFNRNPLFNVDFLGNGIFIGSPTSRGFTVATPEPATLFLLGSSLLAAGAGARRKRKKQPSSKL